MAMLYANNEGDPFEKFRSKRLFGPGGIQGINPDAPVGDEALAALPAPVPEIEPKQGKRLFGDAFASKDSSSNVDEFGLEKPDVNDSTFGKILSFALPTILGATMGMPMAGLATGASVMRGRSDLKKQAAMDAYNKQRLAMIAASKPTEKMRTFAQYKDMSPEDRKLFTSMQGEMNPYQQIRLDLASQRFEHQVGKDTRAEEERNKKFKHSQKKYQDKIQEAKDGIELIKQKVQRANDILSKIPSGRIGGNLAVQMHKIAGNPELKRYNTMTGLTLSNMARTLGGERGVLTDQDIERVKAAWPKPSDTVAERNAATEEINAIVDAAIIKYERREEELLEFNPDERQAPERVHDEAREWARKNPQDPRAKQILQTATQYTQLGQ